MVTVVKIVQTKTKNVFAVTKNVFAGTVTATKFNYSRKNYASLFRKF